MDFRKQLLQPIEFGGDHLTSNMRKSSEFGPLRTFDPYATSGMNTNPIVIGFGIIRQGIVFLTRLIDVCQAVVTLITNNTFVKRVKALQTAVSTFISFCDAFDPDTWVKLAEHVGNSTAATAVKKVDGYDKAVDFAGDPTHAELVSTAEMFDLTAMTVTTMTVCDTEGGTAHAIDLSPYMNPQPATLVINVGGELTAVTGTGAFTLDDMSPGEATGSGFTDEGSGRYSKGGALFKAAPGDGGSLTDHTFDGGKLILTIDGGGPTTVDLGAMNGTTADARAAALAPLLTVAGKTTASASGATVTVKTVKKGLDRIGRCRCATRGARDARAEGPRARHGGRRAIGWAAGRRDQPNCREQAPGGRHQRHRLREELGNRHLVLDRIRRRARDDDLRCRPEERQRRGARRPRPPRSVRQVLQVLHRLAGHGRHVDAPRLSSGAQGARYGVEDRRHAQGAQSRHHRAEDDAGGRHHRGRWRHHARQLGFALRCCQRRDLHRHRRRADHRQDILVHKDKFTPLLEQALFWVKTAESWLDDKSRALEKPRTEFKKTGLGGFRVVSNADVIMLAQQHTRIATADRFESLSNHAQFVTKKTFRLSSRTSAFDVRARHIGLGHETGVPGDKQTFTGSIYLKAKEQTVSLTEKLGSWIDSKKGAIEIGSRDKRKPDPTKPHVIVDDSKVAIGQVDGSNRRGVVVDAGDVTVDGKSSITLGAGGKEGVKIESSGVTISGTIDIGGALSVKGMPVPLAPLVEVAAPDLIAAKIAELTTNTPPCSPSPRASKPASRRSTAHLHRRDAARQSADQPADIAGAREVRRCRQGRPRRPGQSVEGGPREVGRHRRRRDGSRHRRHRRQGHRERGQVPSPRAVSTDAPIPRVPIAQAHPARLHAHAASRGLRDAAFDPEFALLELACGDGGNVLPLAVRFPAARFVGVEAHDATREATLATVREMALANVDIVAPDAIATRDGGYDYAVAHGVYSWVDAEAQRALLTTCAEMLRSDGVAIVSYNTQPGWAIRSVVRSAMLRAAGDTRGEDRVMAGRSAAKRIQRDMGEPHHPYSALLAAELELLEGRDDAELLDDELSPHNEALYVDEFLRRASEAGLQLVAETLPATADGALDAMLRPRLLRDGLAWSDVERQIDVLGFRRLRATLLCSAAARLGPVPVAPSSDDLFWISRLVVDADEPSLRSGPPLAFTTPRGVTIEAERPLLKAALLTLAESWPRALTSKELVTEAIDHLEHRDLLEGAVDDGVITDTLDDIAALRDRGQVDAVPWRPAIDDELAAKPQAHPLFRREAEAGRVTSGPPRAGRARSGGAGRDPAPRRPPRPRCAADRAHSADRRRSADAARWSGTGPGRRHAAHPARAARSA